MKIGRRSLKTIERQEKNIDNELVDKIFESTLKVINKYKISRVLLAAHLKISPATLSEKFTGNGYGKFQAKQKVQIIEFMAKLKADIPDFL